MFHLFVVLPNSMSKLSNNQCTCKLLINTMAAYLYPNEQLHLCFLYFSLLFCCPWYSPLKITLKYSFPSESVNSGEYSRWLHLGEYVHFASGGQLLNTILDHDSQKKEFPNYIQLNMYVPAPVKGSLLNSCYAYYRE